CSGHHRDLPSFPTRRSSDLHRIMSLRVIEIFELIEQELHEAGLLDYLRAGVFLCGGGARIPQVEQAAERVFGMTASLGRTNSIRDRKSTRLNSSHVEISYAV